MALDKIDLSVPRGTILGLTGESGCGKTTLVQLILGLIAPTEGAILIDNIDINSLSTSQRRKLRPHHQIIWQNPDASLNPRMTLKDNILEPLRYYKKLKKNKETKILSTYCDMAELPQKLLLRYPHEVSGGENQRAVIARMLTLRPRLLIADEPTSSLDILVQAQILNLLKRIQKEFEITMLFISHDLQAIGYMCDQIAVMHNGRIVETGNCKQVLATPHSLYCRKLVENAFLPWRFSS